MLQDRSDLKNGIVALDTFPVFAARMRKAP